MLHSCSCSWGLYRNRQKEKNQRPRRLPGRTYTAAFNCRHFLSTPSHPRNQPQLTCGAYRSIRRLEGVEENRRQGNVAVVHSDQHDIGEKLQSAHAFGAQLLSWMVSLPRRTYNKYDGAACITYALFSLHQQKKYSYTLDMR